MKILSLILLMITTDIFAIPVTIKASADNDFIIMLSRGNVRTRVYVNNVGGWEVAKDTVIEVPTFNLGSCSIDFITWNYKWQRGFVGTVTGNLGTVKSGDPRVKTYVTDERYLNYGGSSATYPSDQSIDQMYSTMTLNTPDVYSGGGGIWGSATNLGFSADTYWISPRPPYFNNTFVIHSFSCLDFIIPKYSSPTPTPGPIPNPGPFPNPGPTPDPTPDPVDVKGDHFACYILEKSDNLKAEQITISDQFGAAKVVLGMPKMICNPAQKIHRRQRFPIENLERHLVCYDILEQSPNKDYDLEIHNQFEKRKVKSTNRELVCVPSLKKHL